MRTNSSLSSSYSFSRPNLDQEEWVKSMRNSISSDYTDEVANIPVSIFTVPKTLLATNPDSYIPQQVAVGPFHHFRPDLYDMQRYKLAAARRTQQHINLPFDRIVDAMKAQEPHIRACYHKFLDITSDTLIWMIAVDMAFLLEFLQVFYTGCTRSNYVTSAMSHVVDFSGKKLSHNLILPDLVMAENQIPLFVIRTMLEHQCPNDSAKETLKSMLMGLYHELSPFHEPLLPDVDIDDCFHLLDFLYHMTVPNNKELGFMEFELDDCITELANDGGDRTSLTSVAEPSVLRRFLAYTWKILKKFIRGLVSFIKKIQGSKVVTVVKKLPWRILSHIPIIKLVKVPVEKLFSDLVGKEDEKSVRRRSLESGSGSGSGSPLMDEILIPCVTKLVKAGIFLSPVNGRISDIRYDETTSTLYLPVVSVDMNTDVYLRNMVVHEACVASGPLVVARYTELMNGIVDTEEDARILRERGIVRNHLKSDGEVADMWNGMSKSVKMTKVPTMDKVIEQVNKRYNETWRVKLSKFMKAYVFEYWKFLTFLAALCLLLLTTEQSLCSVYSCNHLFQKSHTSEEAKGMAD